LFCPGRPGRTPPGQSVIEIDKPEPVADAGLHHRCISAPIFSNRSSPPLPDAPPKFKPACRVIRAPPQNRTVVAAAFPAQYSGAIDRVPHRQLATATRFTQMFCIPLIYGNWREVIRATSGYRPLSTPKICFCTSLGAAAGGKGLRGRSPALPRLRTRHSAGARNGERRAPWRTKGGGKHTGRCACCRCGAAGAQRVRPEQNPAPTARPRLMREQRAGPKPSINTMPERVPRFAHHGKPDTSMGGCLTSSYPVRSCCAQVMGVGRTARDGNRSERSCRPKKAPPREPRRVPHAAGHHTVTRKLNHRRPDSQISTQSGGRGPGSRIYSASLAQNWEYMPPPRRPPSSEGPTRQKPRESDRRGQADLLPVDGPTIRTHALAATALRGQGPATTTQQQNAGGPPGMARALPGRNPLPFQRGFRAGQAAVSTSGDLSAGHKIGATGL